MTEDTDRIVIIGAGSAGIRHLSLARASFPGADIRVLRHRTGEPLLPGSDGNLRDLTEAVAFAPQIGVIASPATRHAEAAVALAGAGANLLIEKPLAADAGDARATLTAIEATSGIALVGYNLRFTEALPVLRSAVLDGLVGTVVSARAEAGQWLPGWRPDVDYRASVSARRDAGGGALRELSHELDYLAWILGEPVWAMADVSRRGDLDINVEDTVQAVIGFARDGQASPTAASVSLDLLRLDRTRRCTVIGLGGTLTWDALSGTVDLTGLNGCASLTARADDVATSYARMWEHFVACLRGEAVPVISVADALRTVLLIEACEQSSEVGRRVPLPGDRDEGGAD